MTGKIFTDPLDIDPNLFFLPPTRRGLRRHPYKVPLGHHTLSIECKGVLSTGVDRMLVGNRVGVGLTRSTISSFAPI